MSYSFAKKVIAGTSILTVLSVIAAIVMNKGLELENMIASMIYSLLISILAVGYYETIYNEINFEKGKISGFYLGGSVALILHFLVLKNITNSIILISLSYLCLIIGITQLSPKIRLLQKIDTLIYQHINKLRRIKNEYDEA